MYYWVMFDIAMMRILTYQSYSSYCDKLNRRIVTPALKRYEDKKLFNKIEEGSKTKDKFKKKALFKDVKAVRTENMNGLVEN